MAKASPSGAPSKRAEDYVVEAGLIARARQKDASAVRAIMSRYNRRLYRIARSVLRDDGEAEDAVQEAYLRAFGALATFRPKLEPRHLAHAHRPQRGVGRWRGRGPRLER